MFQDSKGFLWLGTLDGLTRYDGNTFLTYQLESGKHDQISLADNRIKHVAEDKNGFLWIKTVPELFSCYDLQKACFVDFTGTGSDGKTIRKYLCPLMEMCGFGIEGTVYVKLFVRTIGL